MYKEVKMFVFLYSLILLFPLVVADYKHPSIDDVFERLMVVEERLKENKKEVLVLRETTTLQKQLIRKQEIRINSQDIKIHHQKLKINTLEKEVAGLNAISDTNRFNIGSNKREIQEAERRALSIHNENELYGRKKNPLSERKISASGKFPRQVGGGIAFTAFLDHDGNYAAGQTIIFNQIITNDGNGYDIQTGVFTCPEEGMYLFTFFVGERSVRDGVTQIWADLIINSKNIVDAFAETRQYQEDAQGGNTVVIRLGSGDSVWVRSRSAGHHIEGDQTRTTSFTGLYLYS